MTELSEEPLAKPEWERLARLREEVSVVLEGARREKTIGSSLEGAIALTADSALQADRAATGTLGAGLADLFIVSEVLDGVDSKPDSAPEGAWTASQVYPGLSIQFRKARGRRCDRCWRVTPEAEATGLCDRCREVLSKLEAA